MGQKVKNSEELEFFSLNCFDYKIPTQIKDSFEGPEETS